VVDFIPNICADHFWL